MIMTANTTFTSATRPSVATLYLSAPELVRLIRMQESQRTFVPISCAGLISTNRPVSPTIQKTV